MPAPAAVIKDQTGSYPLALLPLAVMTAAGAGIVLLMGRSQARDAEKERQETAAGYSSVLPKA